MSAIRKYASRKCDGPDSVYVSSAEDDANLAAVNEVFWVGRNDCESKPFKEHSYNYAFFPKEGEIISGALLLWLAINGQKGKSIPEFLEYVSAWDESGKCVTGSTKVKVSHPQVNGGQPFETSVEEVKRIARKLASSKEKNLSL